MVKICGSIACGGVLATALFFGCGGDNSSSNPPPGGGTGGTSQDGGQDSSTQDPLLGVWSGTAADVTVTFDIKQVVENAGTKWGQGTATSNKPECFRSGTATLKVTNNIGEFGTMGSGSATSMNTVITVDGEINGATLTGDFKMTGDPAVPACTIAKTPITLTK